MSCVHEHVCLNKKLCFKCYDEKLLKLPKEKTRTRTVVNNRTVAIEKDSWKDLEEQVVIKLNNIPSAKDARRSRASGALWFEKGDVVDEILHPECKERKGNFIQNGADKSFSIKKSWLEKAKAEAVFDNKIMCLPFRFKEDTNIYNVMMFDDIAELVSHYKQIKQENEILRLQLEALIKK